MDDDTLAGTVLQRALDVKPARLTVDEMTRELFGERASGRAPSSAKRSSA